MEAIHIGFFAFPAQHVSELLQLDKQWRDAFNAREEDFQLRENEMFLAARSVAMHRAERDGDRAWDAYVEVTGFCCRSCWQDSGQNVFSPEETKRFAEAVTKLEKRLGADKLVQRIARRCYEPDPEATLAVYQAFREVLQFAVDHHLAMTWAVLNDNAEAELIEKRRQAELSRLADEARGREPPLPPRTQSPLKAYIERENLRIERHEAARMKLPEPLWLAAVPDETVAKIRPLLQQCVLQMLPDAPLQSFDDTFSHAQHLHDSGAYKRIAKLSKKAYKLLDRHAVARAHLTKGGEETLLDELGLALMDWDSDQGRERRLVDSTGVYQRAEAAALLQAITQWEAQKGGEDAAVAALVGDTQVSPPMARRAYRVAKNMLQAAVHNRCGFVTMAFAPDK